MTGGHECPNIERFKQPHLMIESTEGSWVPELNFSSPVEFSTTKIHSGDRPGPTVQDRSRLLV